MSLQNLAANFNLQIANNNGQVVIDLTALNTSGDSNVAQLLSDISDYLGLQTGDSLTVTNLATGDVTVNAADTVLTIGGNGNIEFLDTRMSVRKLLFTEENNILDLFIHTDTFTPIAGGNWDFNTSFPSLFVFTPFDGALKNQAFLYATYYSGSAPVSYTINGDIIIPSPFLNFYAQFDMTLPVLGPALMFLSQFNKTTPAGQAYLFGSIDIYHDITGPYLDFPDIRLVAFLNKGATFTVFNFLNVSDPRLEVQVVNIDDTLDPTDTDITPTLFFTTDLALGSGSSAITLKFKARLDTNDNPVLMLMIEDVNNSATLENVFQLMNGNRWSLPQPLEGFFDEIEFKQFIATLFVDTSNQFTLSEISVKVGSNKNKKIPLFGPFQDLSIDATWIILNPLDPKAKTMLSYYDGHLDVPGIGGYLDVELSIF